jgi:hypothetical protein
MGFLQDKLCEQKQNVASKRIQNVNKDRVFQKKKLTTWKDPNSTSIVESQIIETTYLQ